MLIATLVTSDGSALPTGGAYRMTGHISGTGTEQVSMAVFWNENGTWYCNNTFAGGSSSNHIEFLISGGVPKIKTWHPNNYNINVSHERLSLDEGSGTDNLRGYFGSDSFLKWTESTNARVVTGTIAATGGNSGKWNTANEWGDHSTKGYITGFTNTNEFTTGATFNSGNGVITFTRNNGGDTFTVDIDNRYLPLAGGTLTGDLTIDNNIPRIDFKPDSSGSNVGGRIEMNENGNLWVNAQGGKDLWLNWYSPTSPSSKADLQVGDGNEGSSILTVQGTTRRVGINKTGPTQALDVLGNIVASGTVTASGGNSGNWNTAYGWGDHSGNYLPIVGGTLTGDLTVGSTSRASNTVIKALSGDSNRSGFEAYGSSQGNGYLYVGQSTTHGGGISYNGDNSPAFVNGESADRITFYRRTAGVDSEVFSYNHNSDSVYFNGEILPSTINTGQGSTEVHLMNQNIRTTDDVQFGKGKFSEQVSVNNRTAISVAHWAASSNTTGAIKIKVPGTHTSNWSMFVLRITTYEYTSNAHPIYYVSGHD